MTIKEFSASAEYASQNIGLEFFTSVSHLMPFMLTVLRAEDFKVLYVNEKLETLLGFTAQDLKDREGALLNEVVPEGQEKIFEAVAQLQTDPNVQAVKFLVRVRAKNGEWLYLENTLSVFRRDANGQPAEYLGLSEDVSTRIELETRNRQLEHMVRLAEESFQFGKWEYDPITHDVFWSDGILDILEVQHERATFDISRYRALIHPEDLEGMKGVVRHTASTAQPYMFEYRVVLPSGTQKHIREYGRPILDEGKKVSKIVGISWDITSEHTAAEALKKYTIQIAEAESLLNLGTWEWDMLGERVKWSDGYWNLLEYPESERDNDWVPIHQFYNHVEPDDEPIARKLEAQNLQLAENNQPQEQEMKMRTRVGNIKYIINHSRVIEWKDGKPARSVGFSADVTHMKSIQKSLENKVLELGKAYQEAEQFAYVASHDLQEPLRKISAFGERLQQRCGANFDADCRLYLDRILDGTTRMRVLIDNLLTLSRTKRQPEQFVKTDLNKILEEVKNDLEVKIQERGAGIVSGKLPVLEAIPLQMQQLFQNLLSNALKFSKKDGSPIIELSSDSLTQKQKYDLNLDLFTDFALIRVADNGIGFEPSYAEAIFTPFKRLHGRSEYEGTGIGLAICKKVVQNHQGTMWAESEPGKGAAFFIALPMVQAKD